MARNFKLDRNALRRAVEPGVRKLTGEITRDYADMGRRLEGKPLDEIRAELVRYHQGRGGDFSDPELTKYAQALRDGQPIKFEYGGTIR